MAANGDILKITQRFLQDDNEAFMVGYWQVSDIASPTPITELSIAQAFHEEFTQTLWPAVGHPSATNESTLVDNPDTMAFGLYEDAIVGGFGGDAAPAFTAIKVRQLVTSRLTRSGWKRIPFTAEGAFVGNSLALPAPTLSMISHFYGGVLELLNTLGDPLCDLVPVIVKRVETPVGSGNYIPDISQYQLVSTAVAQAPTTQNSRKV